MKTNDENLMMDLMMKKALELIHKLFKLKPKINGSKSLYVVILNLKWEIVKLYKLYFSASIFTQIL